jgi:hypothetical protein
VTNSHLDLPHGGDETDGSLLQSLTSPRGGEDV